MVRITVFMSVSGTDAPICGGGRRPPPCVDDAIQHYGFQLPGCKAIIKLHGHMAVKWGVGLKGLKV